MSDIQKGDLGKPKSDGKIDQENTVKNAIGEKKGGMSKKEFERISKLAIDKYFRKYTAKMRIDKKFINYKTARNYVSSEMLKDSDFLQIMKEINESFTHEVFFDTIFNEFALQILDEEDGGRFNKDEAHIKSRMKFEILCLEIGSESIRRAMNNSNIIDKETKLQIEIEMKRHNKIGLVRTKIKRNEKNKFILEDQIARVIWNMCEKNWIKKEVQNGGMTQEEFEKLLNEVMEEIYRMGIANKEKLKNGTLTYEDYSSLILESLNRHSSYLKMTEAMQSNKSYEQQFHAKMCNIEAQINHRTKLIYVEKREEFESLCNRILKKCYSHVLEQLMDVDATHLHLSNYEYIFDEIVKKHTDYAQFSKMTKEDDQLVMLYLPLLTNYATSVMAEHKEKWCKLNQEEVAGSILPKNSYAANEITSIEEFIECFDGIIEKVEKVVHSHRRLLETGLMRALAYNVIIQETINGHVMNLKLNAAMSADGSYKKMMKIISLKNHLKTFGKQVQKTIDQDGESQSSNEMEILCHQVFKACYYQVLRRINNVAGTELTSKDYEDHDNIDQFLNVLDELIENNPDPKSMWIIPRIMFVFDSLGLEYYNKLMNEHKKNCEPTESKDLMTDNEHVSEVESGPVSRNDEQKTEETEKVKDEETKKDGCEECSKHDESTQQLLRKIQKLENQMIIERKKCDNVRKEKEKSENLVKKLEKAEKTMAENVKKEKEASKKLVEDLKIEKENSRCIAENLEIGRSKLENLEKENQNYDDSLKWYKSELEKSEQLIEDMKETRENEEKEKKEMANTISAMEEFQRINIQETEEWKAQIMELGKMHEEKKQWETCVQDLKKEEAKCESLRKEKMNLEKELERTERRNKQFIDEILENMQKENQNNEDSLKWFRSELEKSELLIENLQEKRENEKKKYEQIANKMAEMEEFQRINNKETEEWKVQFMKIEHQQMANKISAMEEFQRINNKETEEWKAQIMKMFEKQAEELKIAKQELKKYEARK